MVILTEQLVEAKSKVSDIRHALHLNAWGSDLHDISILLRMPRLEVLALSVNKIRSLASLQNCLRLKELYLRRNEIPSFDELKHLRNAQGLRILWMDENPCSEAAGGNYRACVLRMLPQVTMLDDVEVCESELTAALHSMPYPAPKSKIRAPNRPKSVANPKATAARASRERFERERERLRDGCSSMGIPGGRLRAPVGRDPLPTFGEGSAEDEVLLPVPSPRERRRFASVRSLPDCLREDPLPALPLPAVSPVPSRSGTHSRHSMGSTVPRCRAAAEAAGQSAFCVAQSRLSGAIESSFVRRPSTAPLLGTTGTSEGILGATRTSSPRYNLLASALCLIRELDEPSLEVLSHAISEMVQQRSHIL